MQNIYYCYDFKKVAYVNYNKTSSQESEKYDPEILLEFK